MSNTNRLSKGTCPICHLSVHADEPHERCYKHKRCVHKAPTVYVLVRTSDREGRFPSHETGSETEVLGVFATHAQAIKAKRREAEGYESIGEDIYHQGENYFTMIRIFQETLNVDDDDEDDDDEGDYWMCLTVLLFQSVLFLFESYPRATL